MSISKKFLPKKNICRVKFTLHNSVVGDAEQIAIVGVFNFWQSDKNLMKRDTKGNFTAQIDLPMNKIYQFRYLIDKYFWDNEWEADGLVSTPFEETYNSLINCNLGK